MQVAILTPIRLLGDGLKQYFEALPDVSVSAVVNAIPDLVRHLEIDGIEVVIVDVTQMPDLAEMREFALRFPMVALVALGLKDQRQEVIRCGQAGFAGYVGRDASAEGLCKAMRDAMAGKLECSEEVSGGLLRALFRAPSPLDEPAQAPLTRRETDVLHLIGRGHTNKEIARALNLSESTVKHHVHNVLDKMQMPRRTHVMRYVRDRPWLAV